MILRSHGIATVYTSPLRRARQTALRIVEAIRVPLSEDVGLVEVDTGLWTGLTWHEIESQWPDEFQAFQEDAETQGYLGGENLAQVRERVLPVIDTILSRHPGQTILIVSHGVVNRVLLAHWLGLPLRFSRKLPQDNAGVNVLEIDGGQRKVRSINWTASRKGTSNSESGNGHLGGKAAPARWFHRFFRDYRVGGG